VGREIPTALARVLTVVPDLGRAASSRSRRTALVTDLLAISAGSPAPAVIGSTTVGSLMAPSSFFGAATVSGVNAPRLTS